MTLLTESDTPTSWEDAVAAALHTLCLRRTGQVTGTPAARIVHRYLTAEAPDREHAAFRVQLGLCALDLTEDTPARQQITDTLAHDALETSDAYLARDILAHQACHVRIDAETERTLRTIVQTANLGRGTLPAELHDNLMESVSFSESILNEILQNEKNQ